MSVSNLFQPNNFNLYSGSLLVGQGVTGSISNNVAFEVSGNLPFLLPRMTTATRDSLIAINGMLIYNTDLQATQVFQDFSWVTFSVGP